MKKNIFTLLSICLAFSSFGQFSSAVLDFNNVSARATDGGTLFQDEAIGAAAYEIPRVRELVPFIIVLFGLLEMMHQAHFE